MTINVRVVTNTTNVRVVTDSPKIKTTVSSGVIMARTLQELLDVDLSGVSDKYVIMYDASIQKYTAVNPDNVLSAASSTELTSPGLPTNFADTFDAILDDKINLDAGTF
jgi:hypothetical protein